MVRRSAQRLATTFFVVLSLLFSQLALANYVCPRAAFSGPGAPAVVMEMAPGEPCESMAVDAGEPMPHEQSVLCHQHCANAPQSFDPVQAPSVSLPAVVLVLVVPALQDAADSTAALALAADTGQARPPPDPLFLSTLRLRV